MNRITALGTTIALGFGTSYGYLEYKTNKNRKLVDQVKNKTNSRFLDSTRPNNDSFGINWGFKADSMVRNLKINLNHRLL